MNEDYESLSHWGMFEIPKPQPKVQEKIKQFEKVQFCEFEPTEEVVC